MGFAGGAYVLAVWAALGVGLASADEGSAVRPPSRAGPRAAEPAAGRFLVAARGLPGPFAESVVLLLEHGGEGSMGLVINRPTSLPLRALLPESADPDRPQGQETRVWAGGPVAPDTVRILLRSGEALAGAEAVVDDVLWTGSADAWEEARRRGVPFRAYAGYAGWAPGQLDGELADGAWWVAPADADSVFTESPESVWRTLLRRVEGLRTRAAPPAGLALRAAP